MKRIVLYLLIVFFLQNLQAQDKIYEAKVLAEAEAIQLTLRNSRELQSRQTNTQIADYRYDSAGLIKNPVLRISDISDRYYKDEVDEFFDELRVGVRWNPPGLGESTEKKQQAKVRLWEKKVNFLGYRHELIARARNNYSNVIMYDRLAELAEKRLTFETERMAIIDQMVGLGRRSIVYQTKARMWLNESRNDVGRTLQRKSLARRKLTKKTGYPEDMIVIEEELPRITHTLQELIRIAFTNRPEMGLVEERIELAVKQKRLEQYKLLPWFTFIDISRHTEEGRRKDYNELRLGIRLPVFNWNLGNIKATNLAVTRKEGQLDAIRENIEDEVEDAFIVYSDLQLDWVTFKSDAEKMIRMSLIVIDEARKHETLAADEVLEMELTVIETEKILSKKRNALAHALIDLYTILGVEGPEMPEAGEQK